MPDTRAITNPNVARKAQAILVLLVLAIAIPAPSRAADRAPIKRFGAKVKKGFVLAGNKIAHGTRNLRDRLENNHDDGNHDDGKIRRLLSRLKGKGSNLPDYEGDWQWPVAESDEVVISSEFGPRWGKEHHGIDLAGDAGIPVYAAAGGKVIYSGNGLSGYGNVVIIQHDDDLTSLYAHNEKLMVEEGTRVEAGQRIARLGSTGRSTGPHLHFEIRRGEDHVNPRRYLPAGAF